MKEAAEMRFAVSAWEIVFLFAAIAVVLVFFLIPIGKERRFDLKQMLLTVCMLSLLVASYSCMTKGQTVINSDTATSILLAREQIHARSLFPEGWCYANGDVWAFSQNLIAIPLTYLIENQAIARQLQAVLLVMLTVLSMHYQCKNCFEDSSWIISVPLFSIFLYGTLDMVLYQSAYTMQMLNMALSVTWLAKIIQNKCEKRIKLIFIIFISIMTMGGVRPLAEIILPFVGTIAVCFYLNNINAKVFECKDKILTVVKNELLVIVPALVGFCVYLYVSSTHLMGDTVNNAMFFVDSVSLSLIHI